jgi:hypothetical protein
MANGDSPLSDALYDKAAAIAERHLEAALDEAGELEHLVAIMMLEASVNAAVDLTSKGDIVGLLRDLADQIEKDRDEDD